MLTHLRNQILSGERSPGEYIPSEHELAQIFQLSRPSVRKVLSELADEGLITIMHGLGSKINAPDQARTVLHLFWFVPSFEYTVISELVDRFNRTNRSISVQLTPIPRESLSSSQQGIQAVSIKPDLIGLNNNQFFSMIPNGLHHYLKPLSLNMEERLYPSLLRAFAHEQQLYAAPIIFSPIVLAYNKSLFDRHGEQVPDASWTWQKLLDASVRLTGFTGDQADQYGFCFSSSLNRWPLFVLHNGGTFDASPSPDEREARTIEALQFTADLIYKHRVSPVSSGSHAGLDMELFVRGKAGMITTSYGFIDRLNETGFDWDFIKFPGRGGNGLGITTGLGITPHCTSPDAAAEFIRFMLSDPIQAYLKYHVSSLPAVKQVAEWTEYPHIPFPGKGYYTFADMMPELVTFKDFGLSHQQLSDMHKELSLLWANVEPAAEVWKSLRRKWNIGSAVL
jgi:multiple sugar transport system substrate-binding protein